MKNKKNIIIFSVIISLILSVGVFTAFLKLNNNKLIENVKAESTKVTEKVIEKVSDKTENVGDTSAVTEKVVEKETEKEIQSDEKENQAGISKVNEKVTEEKVPATTKSPEITAKKQETTTKKQETTTKKVESTTKASETTTKKQETTTEKVTEKPTTTQPTVTTIFNCGTLSGGYSATNYETAILNAINAKRNENGLSSVSYNANIHTLARVRADEQSLLKGHTRPNGNKASTIFKDKGINFTHFGEIIAVNIPDTDAGVELAIKMWMESSGHRNAVLNNNYLYAAVAASPAGNGYMNIVCLFYNYIG